MHLIILLIITIPAFQILFNNFYFSMHDDQHIVRLFLLNEGIKQGQFYPRWVDGLGFGYGYPLYNFYPPLIYYLAEFFHLAGFSFIWSVKLVIIVGFIAAAFGMYWFLKEFVSKWTAILGAAIYTYFFYHAVLVYVRGALAEFFTLSLLPFVFLGIYKIYKYHNQSSVILLAVSFALLILTHPLVAFPALLFVGLFFLFLLFLTQKKTQFIGLFIIGLLVGLSLSSFFWLPSMMERKYTLVDTILTKELANYKEHFIAPLQFWYSPWGYGGSTPGLGDGLTFQLGKVAIFLSLGAIGLSFLYLRRLRLPSFKLFYFFIFLLFFSLLMSTQYSSFIWDNIKYLWYLQFPWRFLTFTAFFISIVSSYGLFFVEQLVVCHFDRSGEISLKKRFLGKLGMTVITLFIVLIIIVKYQPYFRPQQLLITNDKQRTSFEEVAWRISSTSYEFVPKGVKTKKTELGTTTLAIEKKDLPKSPFKIISGKAIVKTDKDKFGEKIFTIDVTDPIMFRLNTYYFPGWQAELDGNKLVISDDNNLKLITVPIPKGQHQVKFRFTDTWPRQLGNLISAVTAIILGVAIVGTKIWPIRLPVFRKS